MNKKLYWIIRALISRIRFILNTIRYRCTCKIESIKRGCSVFVYTLKTIVSQVLLYSLVAFILYYADSLLINYNKQGSTNFIEGNAIIAIIIGGMGVAGVILGLHYSSIASIYSQVYSNAPKTISDAFHRDVITNRSIKHITGFFVFGSILLVECVTIRYPYHVTMVAFLTLSVHLIVTFSITRNRTYQLSDSFRLSENIYPIIFSTIEKTTKHSYVGEDVSFQHHLQKVVSNQLETLKDIAFYNQNNAPNNNAAMVQFMKNNLILLHRYLKIKTRIPFDSNWYAEEAVYKQWHVTSDQEVQVHTKTGTALQPDKQTNFTWFEEAIIEINDVCLSKLYRDKDYNNLYSYLLLTSESSKYATEGYSLPFWIKQLNIIKENILSLLQSDESPQNNRDIQIAIVDAVSLAFLSLIVEIDHNLTTIDICTIQNNAIEIADSATIAISNDRFYNNQPVKDIFTRVKDEIDIEQSRITPDWYIKQIVAKELFDYCNEVLKILESVFLGIFDLGTKMGEAGHNDLAIIALCRYFEMRSKCEPLLQIVKVIISELEEAHKERVVIWDESYFDTFTKKQENLFEKYIESIIKYSEEFAIENWENREKHPDFLGGCYNSICEYLIQSIENNDFDKFKKMHSKFIKLAILYKEYIRSDLIKHKEEYLQNRIFYVASAPYVEYAKICSYAIIWGEFTNNTEWRKLVELETKQFMTTKAGKDFIERIPEIIELRWNILHGIGNRDIINTDWDLRIAKAMKDSSNCQYEYHEYGRKSLKTASRLLKTFCGDYFDQTGFSHPTEDIYIVSCLNKLMEPDKQYYGRFDWGKDINEMPE